MGRLVSVSKRQKKLSEEQIDKIVIAQADDDSAWEEPIQVSTQANRAALKISIPSKE